MTNIDEVAARSGVSKSTVSRAFSRPESVRAETREHILRIAQEVGYAPSPVARALAGGPTGSIGLFVPDIANPFFPPLIKAAQAQARRYGYSVVVADSDEHAEDEYSIVADMKRRVDGLILASPRMDPERLSDLLEGIPAVVINRDAPGAVVSVFTTTDGVSQALEHLHALGHHRIVYVAGPAGSYSNEVRTATIQSTASVLGVDLVEVGNFQPTFESGVRATDLVIASGATAAIAYNDLIALGMMAQLKLREYAIGRDISLVGIDDVWLTSTLTPPLTTVRMPGDTAGTVSARALIESIRGTTPAPPSSIMLPSELIVRGTTGRPVRTADQDPGPLASANEPNAARS